MSLRCAGSGPLSVVLRAGWVTNAARAVDLLVLAPGDDVQVPLAVVAFVAAYQVGAGELGQIVLDVYRAVLRTQGPEQSGDDGGLVAEAAVVVGLGE
ncbi:hypothetical protein BKA18_002102 [Streptomyces auratus]